MMTIYAPPFDRCPGHPGPDPRRRSRVGLDRATQPVRPPPRATTSVAAVGRPERAIPRWIRRSTRSVDPSVDPSGDPSTRARSRARLDSSREPACEDDADESEAPEPTDDRRSAADATSRRRIATAACNTAAGIDPTATPSPRRRTGHRARQRDPARARQLHQEPAGAGLGQRARASGREPQRKAAREAAQGGRGRQPATRRRPSGRRRTTPPQSGDGTTTRQRRDPGNSGTTATAGRTATAAVDGCCARAANGPLTLTGC